MNPTARKTMSLAVATLLAFGLVATAVTVMAPAADAYSISGSASVTIWCDKLDDVAGAHCEEEHDVEGDAPPE